MPGIETAILDLGLLDQLARQDTAVHRLDPRAKVLATLVFSVAVVSFNRYEVGRLLPFALYPVALMAAGGVPLRFLARKLLAVAPFAILVGALNPLIDREVLYHLGGLAITGGWASFASIVLRFVLTAGAALVLVAVTGFNAACLGLLKLGAPRAFVMQLLFLYRYLFVLVEEAARMGRARALRSFGNRGMGLSAFAPLVGQLLLRTLDRAQRIHQAMLCRGFSGEVRLLARLSFGRREVVFVALWSAFFALARWVDIPAWLGRIFTGGLS